MAGAVLERRCEDCNRDSHPARVQLLVPSWFPPGVSHPPGIGAAPRAARRFEDSPGHGGPGLSSSGAVKTAMETRTQYACSEAPLPIIAPTIRPRALSSSGAREDCHEDEDKNEDENENETEDGKVMFFFGATGTRLSLLL